MRAGLKGSRRAFRRDRALRAGERTSRAGRRDGARSFAGAGDGNRARRARTLPRPKFRIGVSVVDRGGHVLISMRDDGTAHHVVELAERKAYTARIFRQTTREFVERIINNPRSQGLKDTKGALASFGGVPIKVGEETIGGVGVSGAPGGPNDEACAAAGIQKVADQLK